MRFSARCAFVILGLGFVAGCGAHGSSLGGSSLNVTPGAFPHNKTLNYIGAQQVNPLRSIGSQEDVIAYQDGNMLYLKSTSGRNVAVIGIDLTWGGAITDLSLNGTNYVNAHDTGREVQAALYDGADHYTQCTSRRDSWGWDPVQAGDYEDNGSPVLQKIVRKTSIYIKTHAADWCPLNKGGGPGKPVLDDVYFEQTISVIPDEPLAFKVTYRLSEFGKGIHYNSHQELPAVYTNKGYDRLVYYSGAKPWTSGALAERFVKRCCPSYYSAEDWNAYVNSSGKGIAVYVPGQYPYVVAVAFPSSGSGSKGESTWYFTGLLNEFTVAPQYTLAADVYLIPGNVGDARKIIYALHERSTSADPFAPFIGSIDSPPSHGHVSGEMAVYGWAFNYDAGPLTVDIFIDSVKRGVAQYGLSRPDVHKVWPHEPVDVGFGNFYFDTTKLSNGQHTLTIHATDNKGRTAVANPVPFSVSN
jgi:hypothetical protein